MFRVPTALENLRKKEQQYQAAVTSPIFPVLCQPFRNRPLKNPSHIGMLAY